MATVEAGAVRRDLPPRMFSMQCRIENAPDEPEHRVAHLHRDIRNDRRLHPGDPED